MADDERAVGERGLQRALSRLDSDLRNGDCPLPSLAETVGWLDGLARCYRDGVGGSAFETHRDNDPDGRSLAGVLYAHAVLEGRPTNMARATHYGGPGLHAPGVAQLSGALAGRAWRWRRRAALPPPSRAPDGVDFDDLKRYEQRVARRPLAEPVHEAAHFLTATLPREVA